MPTNTFPQILQRLGISLLVTTYQAGRLVMLRADGDLLNTHFRSFAKPMLLAVPVLPGILLPELIDNDFQLLASSLVLP